MTYVTREATYAERGPILQRMQARYPALAALIANGTTRLLVSDDLTSRVTPPLCRTVASPTDLDELEPSATSVTSESHGGQELADLVLASLDGLRSAQERAIDDEVTRALGGAA